MRLGGNEEWRVRDTYRWDVARSSFWRYDWGACLRKTLNRFSSFFSFWVEVLFFFFDGEGSSKSAAVVRSTTGTFPFCTEETAFVLRFFETGVEGDGPFTTSTSSTLVLELVFGIILGVVFDLV